MKKIIITLAIIASLAAAYNLYINRQIDYYSHNLTQFSDGIRYDEETNTVYTSGKLGKFIMQIMEKKAREAGENEFYMEKGEKGNKFYKCILVKKVVYCD
jgi:hypothetical protein